MFVEVSNIKKSYGEGGSYVQVLKGVSVEVEKGELCVIQGTSGSGKSTLLNCIGGLDEVDSGSIKIDGNEIQNGQQSLKEEINERNEMKKLQFLGGNRTPEQERRFQELQHIYQTNQQQIRRQSKDNGMNR